MSITKEVLSRYLTDAGLVVVGDESQDELLEAYGYLFLAGHPSIVKEETK